MNDFCVHDRRLCVLVGDIVGVVLCWLQRGVPNKRWLKIVFKFRSTLTRKYIVDEIIVRLVDVMRGCDRIIERLINAVIASV